MSPTHTRKGEMKTMKLERAEATNTPMGPNQLPQEASFCTGK
jgi:hypothetical protein